MPHRESVVENVYFDASAEISIIYDVYPKRTEEGHGFHDFNEDEEVDRQLLSLKISLGNGEEIDITDRLTEDEKRKLLEADV